ncbi:FAD-dependent oxidoreductase [Novosphingobium sp. 1949]|uniref:FAD-dependent oxidoreductase n=1 Tax=Novosphingobium organovorum TaxID=2930092 RepID=A0ABT0BFZ6_9SPHN|nr:FAD-dependent oxidoreductase [Novosphingobium organovorum]MCJ2183908.1 FAD-dependent oxidoreductase [Novosphingobium organovorum]
MLERPPEPAGNHVVILGGGIAGLSAAETLSKAGMRVTVIEARQSCGGTHRSRDIGPYTFDVGSIFYEDTARIFAMAPGLRELCPTVARRQRRIAPGGGLLHYPIEPRELLRGSRWQLARGLLDLLWSRASVSRDGTLAAICRQRLGDRFFASTGLRDYIARFNHVPPEQVSEGFFFRRMAFIERMTRMGALVRMGARTLFTRRSIKDRPRRDLHVRPREGFAPLFDRIVQRLEARGVEIRLGAELFSIAREGPVFRVRTSQGDLRCPALVSTIPLDTVHRALFGTPSGLVSLDMTTLFVSAAGLDPGVGNVLFNFDRSGLWKRATIYSRIYPDPAIEREYMAVECTIAPDATHDPQRVFDDFAAHLRQLGLARDLALEGHEHVRDCYPLYHPGTEAVLNEVIERITQAGIVPVGRQGRFEYLPTSSGVIRRVGEELALASLGADCPIRGKPAEASHALRA